MGENTLGQRIKSCRKEKKLTQQQVRSKIGISQGQLSDLENDVYLESTFTPKLAKLFGVSAIWLATGEGNKYAHADLSEIALAIARDVSRLPPDKQLEIRHYVAVELAIEEQKRLAAKTKGQKKS